MKRGYFTVNEKFFGKCKMINDILYFYNTNGDVIFTNQQFKSIRIDVNDYRETFGIFNYNGLSGTFHVFSNMEDILSDEVLNFSIC